MIEEITIGNKRIGYQYPTFIIAELSCNHKQDYDVAVKTIHAMKNSGADAVKLQTFKPASLTLDSKKDEFIIKGGTLWDNKSLFDLYQEVYTPWEWHTPIKELVERLDMVFLSSPFDNEAIDFLDSLNVPAYKIASFEITDVGLIKYAASKGKPMIISTGIATDDDIKDAIETCHSVGNDNVVLLKCTSSYPTPWNEVNLNNITKLKKYPCLVGLSDHTPGDVVPLGAVSKGIVIIEKHFILDRKLGGPDSAFSMEPEEFKVMVERVRILEESLGNEEIEVTEKILKNRTFARSLFAVKTIRENEIFTTDNIRSIRPGMGLAPKYLEKILGKRAAKDIEIGTPLSWNLLEAENE